MLDPENTLVFDFGSELVKAGFAGDDFPRSVFPNVIAYDANTSSRYIGHRPVSKSGLPTTNTMENGVIDNFDQWLQICNHAYYTELRRSPDEQPLLMTTSENETSRDKICEYAFEELKVPALYLAYRSPLALYTTGRTTGTVWRCGAEQSSAVAYVAVYEGHFLPHSRVSHGVAGNMLTDHLAKMLSVKGYLLSSAAEKSYVRDLKEKLCFVSMDVKAEDVSREAHVYELPDQQVIRIENERYLLPEKLFDTSCMNGKKNEGWSDETNNAILEGKEDPNSLFSVLPKDLIQKLLSYRFILLNSPVSQITQCIESCDDELRNDLYGSIVFAGGSTMFPGLPERVTRDVQSRTPKKVKVVAVPERKYGVWIGGSILASLSTFTDIWGTKKEFDEFGPSIANIKFF